MSCFQPGLNHSHFRPPPNPLLHRKEGIGGCVDQRTPHDGCFFQQSFHQTLYISFSFVGFVAVLESSHRLPIDSSRMALSLAFLVEYLLWNGHAIMQEGVESRIHFLLSQVCLLSSVVFAFSVYRPTSAMAYIVGWATLVLQGMWLFTAGVHAAFVKMEMHMLVVFLCLQILLLAFVITAGAAFSGQYYKSAQSHTRSQKEYEGIQSTYEDNEELTVPMD